MKKNGFTLVELLGVIIIIALLVILVLPSIVNSVKDSSEKTDDLVLDLIYNASDLYISNHADDFVKTNGNKYIIQLSDLVDEGHIVSPIELSYSDDITDEKCVQVTYDDGYKYELLDKGECVFEINCTLKDNDSDGIADIGEEVSCMREKFYVIPNDSTAHPTATTGNITLLAKYNLDVGNIYDISSSTSTPITNPTGIQSSKAIGFISSTNARYGVLAFSGTMYWGSVTDGTFIYNSNSLLYPHVENYKTYIESIGVDVKEASIMSKSQFDETSKLIESNFNWTSFWLGTAYNYEYVYHVISDGTYNKFSFAYGNNYGVRPVIIIPEDELYIIE